jgi:Flp pilus assembly pilin Flp
VKVVHNVGEGKQIIMPRLWKRLWRDDRGQNLAEFALLLALICLTATSSVWCFGLALKTNYSKASTSVSAAVPGRPLITSENWIRVKPPRVR